MHKVIYLFDFDGVICDSNKEVYNTSLLSYLKFIDADIAFENYDHKSLYTSFQKYRHTARIASDFFLLWSNIFKDKKKVKYKESERAIYKDLFFSSRKKIRNKNLKEWLGMHYIYEQIQDFIVELINTNDVLIVSAKDSDSIFRILNFNDIEIERKRIYGSDKYSDKDEIFKFIRELYPNNKIKFVDDMSGNLMIAKKFEIDCYHANWGYERIECYEEKRFVELSLDNLSNLLVT